MSSATRIIETTVQGEVFTHRVLWSTCQRQLAVARAETRGSWYFHLTAMMMGFMTFESYINFLGTKLAPELWANERSHFRSGQYAGTAGKLLKLCELHGVAFPDKGSRPYQSLTKLKALRDFVAHGKPDEFEMTVSHPEGTNPALIKYTLDDYVSEQQAEETIADVRAQIEALHAAFGAKVGYDIILTNALDGTLAMSSGSMSV